MEQHSLVSIITPTYNHEKFIAQCVESVLAQTYPHWEQIIIDDGSTDRTGEIAARYKDERIKYIRQDNIGIWNLGKTYNRALQISQGELIAVLEGDDFWPTNKLEKQVPSLRQEDIVLSWGKVAFVNLAGKIVCMVPRNVKWFKKAEREQILRRLLFGNFIWPCTVICRKSALLSIGGFKQAEYTPYVDYPTWLELSLIGNFSAVDEMLGYWRLHGQQVSSTMVVSMAEGCKYAIDFFTRMPHELRDLVGVSVDELSLNQRYRMTWVTFKLGRIGLIYGKWHEAKSNFKKALIEGRFLIKLGALVGLICAYFKTDLEWIAGLMHKPRFK